MAFFTRDLPKQFSFIDDGWQWSEIEISNWIRIAIICPLSWINLIPFCVIHPVLLHLRRQSNNSQCTNCHQFNGTSFLPSPTPCNTIADYGDTNSEHPTTRIRVPRKNHLETALNLAKILRQTNIHDDPLARIILNLDRTQRKGTRREWAAHPEILQE